MKLKVISKESNYIVLRTEDDFNAVLVPGVNLCDPFDWKEGDEVTITTSRRDPPLSRLWRDRSGNLLFLFNYFPIDGYCMYRLEADQLVEVGRGSDWRDLTQYMTPLTTTEIKNV